MRAILSAVLLVSLSTSIVVAQDTKIELWADDARNSCELADPGSGLRTIYVFHTGNASATVARFYVPTPACWVGAHWVADAAVGNAQAGTSPIDLTVVYGGCKALPALIARIYYFSNGASLPCCEMMAADPGPLHPPGSGPVNRFVWADCMFDEHPLQPGGQKLVVNADSSCRCPMPLAAEESTWGRVKSLYR